MKLKLRARVRYRQTWDARKEVVAGTYERVEQLRGEEGKLQVRESMSNKRFTVGTESSEASQLIALALWTHKRSSYILPSLKEGY